MVAILDFIQVLPLVKEFHSHHLQEHLSHALSHKMAVKQERTGSKDRSKLVARDSRKVLYSTIGFQKGESGSVSSLCYMVCYPQSFQTNARMLPQLGHDCFFKITSSSSSVILLFSLYAVATKGVIK
jgi:hypothetical protein